MLSWRLEGNETIMGSLYNELLGLYMQHWENLCNTLCPIVHDSTSLVKPAYPFLISPISYKDGKPSESYYTDADIRVMLFGEETNGWKGLRGSDDFNQDDLSVFDCEASAGAVMSCYEDFYATYYDFLSGTFRYNGSFHRGFNRFTAMLNAKYERKRIAYIWNDIVKIGKSRGTGCDRRTLLPIERSFFNVIPEEIRILSPDIIVFYGKYDDIIFDVLGIERKDVTYLSANDDVMKLHTPYPNTYRVPHPSHGHLHDDHLLTVIDDIKIGF